jgi:hypothetical protein
MQLVLGLSLLFLFGMLFIAVANTYTLPLYTWNTYQYYIAEDFKNSFGNSEIVSTFVLHN